MKSLRFILIKTLKRASLSSSLFLVFILLLNGCVANQTNQLYAQPVIAAPVTSVTLSQLSDKKIRGVLNKAYTTHKNNRNGKNADYIKALAEVDSRLFGISVVTADGRVFDIGDTQSQFPIQSISKVFTYAMIMQENGPDAVKEKIGVNATGLPFNSVMAIELIPTRSVNPFVNAGAIASTSLVAGKDSAERWKSIKSNMDAFAAHELEFNEIVYESEVNNNLGNQAISKLLQAKGRIYSDPLEATTVYTKQCSVNVTSHDLAVMGSVLANRGINPISGKKIINATNPPYILSVMATAGLYDNTGEWLYETGTPAKSGVSGGILAVVPGKLAIGVFSPPLDGFGNSVRGQLAAASIIKDLGINPYAPGD